MIKSILGVAGDNKTTSLLHKIDNKTKSVIKSHYPKLYQKIKNRPLDLFDKYLYSPIREYANLRHEVHENQLVKIDKDEKTHKTYKNRSKIDSPEKINKKYNGDSGPSGKALKKNVSTTAQTKIKSRLSAGKRAGNTLSKIFRSKTGRAALYGLGTIAVWNAISSRLFPRYKNSAIPEHYERSYDYIKERTDFGSPVKLHKTTQKALIPYVSSTRSANITTASSVVDSNYALFSHNNAIKHTNY